jgi:Mor family transcriptional regulator
MTTARNNSIIADYLAGAHPRAIADYYKLTEPAIYNILRRYKIKLKGKSNNAKHHYSQTTFNRNTTTTQK